ncbi:DHA2 family efflux MFS transporter permease subunit [Undibacterium oligocarboniphilum]|uniref:DHA2 family efflux MFS transporter permease subunit n=1 Tax=Undibacterium oligocarboniphilum TaxID=666702 RepID=A0A850QDK9_9BURK|nr:DHA2 family efflux MFS transporter permease subunit [Undibacterium oligocarboniphilum]MBC3869795.1 DHA2 family efflux MFS transporter permease subunit [Undibacterium oligocarboniphilum]NVO77398.1 DHA2 family efflux MFS transporter permease subunit [Undibacterium oligocarboniphilum]
MSASTTIEASRVKQYLPWVVATALFMEQLDSTIINTAVPSMAASLAVNPLSLKAVVTSYILSLAVGIPVSGWIADRFGTRRVFSIAVAVFTLSSVMCGLSINLSMLVVARILQGLGAAMMMPVGRLTIVRTFPKSELLAAMNFVIIPALIGPLLGPTVGGLIVHWVSWRAIFFINVPVGLIAQYLIHRHMPDYHGDQPRPLDLRGLVLFGSGAALLSWLLEIFDEHTISLQLTAILFLLAFLLLGGYVLHSQRTSFPLLNLNLFRVRTFRVSVVGGFVTRLGMGGMPFLLPLLYQLGLGLPAWQSGMLMMPSAAAAMGMKLIAARVLQRFGYKQVLIINTLMIGLTIFTFSLITPATPVYLIVALGLAQGLFNSLQFTSMNSMAYADIPPADSSMASTIASTLQQMSMSFGLACGSLVTAWFLSGLPQSDQLAVTSALHHAFLTLGVMTLISSLSFWSLKSKDGESVSKGTQ